MPDAIGAELPGTNQSTNQLVDADTLSMISRNMFGILLFLLIPATLALVVFRRGRQAVGVDQTLPSVNAVAE